MKARLKNGANYMLYLFLRFIPTKLFQLFAHSNPSAQLNLLATLRNSLNLNNKLPITLAESGFQIYSQTDEDGILLYIFAAIGTTNRRCVEVCAGTGIECNSVNLIINHGWDALLIDGDPRKVRIGVQYFNKHKSTYIAPPKFINAWITRDNINDLIQNQGYEGEIDLLTVDMDGVDYWIWEAMDVIKPRVVTVEYQDILGPERSVTVPYADNFEGFAKHVSDGAPDYAGASLSAFAKLAKKKGYRLVGCNRYGYNAFFVLEGLGEEVLPEIPVSDCFKHPKTIKGMKERFPKVEKLEWVEV